MRLTKRMKSALAAKPADEAPLPLSEAVETLKKFPPTKFDQTVEIHIRLGIDPKQADQIVRGSIVLHMALANQNVLSFLPKEILLMMQLPLVQRKLVAMTSQKKSKVVGPILMCALQHQT